jgi:Asp/Glu/hydantoin racemase
MLGILMLQTRFPRLPGDVGHPGSFDFPVRHRVVSGARPARVVRGKADDEALLADFVRAGHELVREGATALTTSCGFLARWQRELQAALPVPVWTSALLQLAECPARRCGVITIEAASLTSAHFEAVGADPRTPVEGIEPGSPLHRTLLEDRAELDPEDARQQVLAAGHRLLRRHPELDTLVLECTNLPPYAPALRSETGRPVLDVLTMLNARWAALGARAIAPLPENR